VQRIGLQLLDGAAEAASASELSRIPVLAPSEAYAARAVDAAGHLGVTRMYGRTMPEFAGGDPRLAEEKWPNAFALSRRLLTLPAHGRLSGGAVRRLVALLDHAHAAR
jgi:hypothetical protein